MDSTCSSHGWHLALQRGCGGGVVGTGVCASPRSCCNNQGLCGTGEGR